MVRLPNQIEEETLQSALSDVLEVFQKHRLTINFGFSVGLAVCNYATKHQYNLSEAHTSELADLMAETVQNTIHKFLHDKGY